MNKEKIKNIINIQKPDVQLKVKYGATNSVIDDAYIELKLKTRKPIIDEILKVLTKL